MHTDNDVAMTPLIQRQQELKILSTLLSSADFKEYSEKHKNLLSEFSNRGYKNNDTTKWDLLFDDFRFKSNATDQRTQKMHAICQLLSPESSNAPPIWPNFFQILHQSLTHIHTQQKLDSLLCQTVRELIDLQIQNLQKRIEAGNQRLSNISSQSPTFCCLSRNRSIALLGSGLMGSSLLLHLNPSFAFLAGLQISPPLFVGLFVIGALMTGYGVSRRPVNNTNTSQHPPWYANRMSSAIRLGLSLFTNWPFIPLSIVPENSRTPSQTK